MKGAFILAGLIVAGCAPAPRSADYFQTHQADAARVIAKCQSGAQRGRECDNARRGEAARRDRVRQELMRKAFR